MTEAQLPVFRWVRLQLKCSLRISEEIHMAPVVKPSWPRSELVLGTSSGDVGDGHQSSTFTYGDLGERDRKAV